MAHMEIFFGIILRGGVAKTSMSGGFGIKRGHMSYSLNSLKGVIQGII